MKRALWPLWRTETNVEGDVSASVQSGTFSGPVGTGGNVTINMQAPQPEQPKTPREYLNSMWLMMLESERQSRAYRRLVIFWLIGLTALVLANILASVIGAWAWIARFGWYW